MATETMAGADVRSDAALLSRAKTGDSEALAALYEATYPELWHTARALLKNDEDVMDVLQDTYLKAFTRLDTVEKPESLRPWLRQIAANTARDCLRRRKPTLFSELQNEDAQLLPEPEEAREDALPELALDRKETQRLVREMLDSLSDGQRLVVGMYYYQELPVREIAAQLGLPQNTVKSQLRIGRQKLEKRVLLLEKQGVRLGGAAPIAFFRAVLRQGVDATPVPKAAGKLTRAVSSGGVRALQTAGGMKVKTLTTAGLWAKRIAIGVGALAAAAGVAVGAGVLLQGGQDGGDVRPVEDAAAQAEDWRALYRDRLAGESDTGDDLWMASRWIDDAVCGRSTEYFYLADVGQAAPLLIARVELADHLEYGLNEYWLCTMACRDGRAMESFVTFRDGTDVHAEQSGLLYREASDSLLVYTLYGDLSYTPDGWLESTGWHLRVPAEADYDKTQPVESRLVQVEQLSVVSPRGGMPQDELLCITDPESGAQRYFCSIEPRQDRTEYRELEEAEYQAKRGTYLGEGTLRLIDDHGLEQLAALPLADVRGPIDIQAVVEELGGFTESQFVARLALQGRRPFSEQYAALVADPAQQEQLLEEEYPAAVFGDRSAAQWDYAMFGGPEGYYELILRCRTENDWYLMSVTYGNGEPHFDYQHFADAGRIDGLYFASGSVLPRYVLETQEGTLCLIPGLKYWEEAGAAACAIDFLPQEEMYVRLTGDPLEASTVREDTARPIRELLEESAEGLSRPALLARWAEHPELLMQQPLDELRKAGADLSTVTWRFARLRGEGGYDECPDLLLCCSVQTPAGEDWMLGMLTMGELGGALRIRTSTSECIYMPAGHPWDVAISSDGDLSVEQIAAADTEPVVTFITREDYDGDCDYVLSVYWPLGSGYVNECGSFTGSVIGHRLRLLEQAEMLSLLKAGELVRDYVD